MGTKSNMIQFLIAEEPDLEVEDINLLMSEMGLHEMATNDIVVVKRKKKVLMLLDMILLHSKIEMFQ